MILKIELANFFSIKEKVCIDFRAANINTETARALADNVIDWNGTPVLKSIGLFGHNASGKSNIIKAIRFCCMLVLESHQHNEGTVFNFQPFKFDGYDKKPSSFLIDFVCNDIEYEYVFSLTRTEILSEQLYAYPNGRRAKVFTREGNTYTFGALMRRGNDVAVNTSKKNLFLTRASSMNRDIAQTVYVYFLEKFLLGFVDFNNHTDIIQSLFESNKSLILQAMEICDSDIQDIRLAKERITAPFPVFNGEVISIKEFQQREIERVRFKTTHRHSPEVEFDMEDEESDGTYQLFRILLRFLDVVRSEKSLLLDEFDGSLHTRLSDFVLDLIHASRKSQLLYTSHNTNLIDVKRLRKDQIVFVNKRQDGSTEVYSLYDYKDFRENMDAEKAYLQGRFDAVPIVSSSVSSLKKLLYETPVSPSNEKTLL